MSQEKKSKRKIIIYYAVLAACILLIAAVTVTVIFATRGANSALELQTPGSDSQLNGDDEGDGDGEEEQPADDVSSAYVFVAPVAELDVVNDYTFYYNKTLDCYHYHTGIDISAVAGAEVMACVDGTVESITVGDVLDGTKIVLSHADGVKTVYCFVDAAKDLKVGDAVNRGDVIGTVAEAVGSEYKEGAHLHFEVYKNGELADPNDYLDISEK